MLYRVAHSLNASYGLAVAWAYIIAFLAAISLLFIFPQVTLLLFFLGLASLGLAIGLGWLIDSATRAIARRAIGAGRCPRCRDTCAAEYGHHSEWICDRCGSEFKADGSELNQLERSRYIERVPE